MSKNTRHKKRFWPLIFLGLLLICLIIMADSRFRIVTDEYTVYAENLPSGFDGFKIVQLSDLHGASYGKENVKLIRAVKDAQPDLIALTGDFVESGDYLPELYDLCKNLRAVSPVYFVSGNHDWASRQIDEIADVLSDSGATYLRNDYTLLQSGDDSIVLCGVEDPNGYADMIKPDGLVDIIRDQYPDKYLILLAHRNYWIDIYPDLPVDIIFCGHGHGGIIRIPFIGGVLGTNLELFPEYTAGLYDGTHYKMLVSRGLGNIAHIPRFLNNPQIVSVTFEAK